MFETLLATVADHLPDGGQKSILVVDDEVDIRESLQTLFESEFPGTSVFVAGSGKEALAIMETNQINLVISDYKMPEMNGMELLTRVQDRSPKTKRALITAFPDSLMVGGKDAPSLEFFLAKPIKIDTIVAHTQRSLSAQ